MIGNYLILFIYNIKYEVCVRLGTYLYYVIRIMFEPWLGLGFTGTLLKYQTIRSVRMRCWYYDLRKFVARVSVTLSNNYITIVRPRVGNFYIIWGTFFIFRIICWSGGPELFKMGNLDLRTPWSYNTLWLRDKKNFLTPSYLI